MTAAISAGRQIPDDVAAAGTARLRTRAPHAGRPAVVTLLAPHPTTVLHFARIARLPAERAGHTGPNLDCAMPHLVIEITENTRLNCSQEELLDEANAALLASGQFQEADIKSRCLTLSTFRQGVEAEERAFVHARLSILDGRELAVRRALGQAVCDVIAEAVRPATDGRTVQVSVEVCEMERASYAKHIVGAAH